MGKKFIPGMELSKKYYNEIVKKIIIRAFPALKYSSGLIDYGSDVLGYDTEVSMDHQWGPRLSIFLAPIDLQKYGIELDNALSEQLPHDFYGFSTNFSGSKEDYIRRMENSNNGKVKHLIRIHSLEDFFQQHLGFNIHDEIKPLDWLFFPKQRLATIYKGQVFHDDLNLKAIKKKLEYYPIDIWYYLMACEWEKIATEEAFVGRCGDVDDDLGSSLIASRIIQSLVNLCFLQEKKYIPYSKWYGTAFKNLEAARILYPICISILHSSNWKERESYLSKAYSFMANKHNELQITEPLNSVVKPYYGRKYLVISAQDFSEKIFAKINDPEIRKLNRIGNIDQVTNTSRILENVETISKFKYLYNSNFEAHK